MIRWFFDIPSKLIHWRLNLVRTLGAYVPWLRRDDGSMKVHAGTLVDLFATILSGRRHLSARDADAALDILRYTFPEVEHRWLSNRFERSMRANLTVADVLASAASGRDSIPAAMPSSVPRPILRRRVSASSNRTRCVMPSCS